MTSRMTHEFEVGLPKLGFGMMRLPRVEGSDGVIDIDQTCIMVDEFLSAGMKYIDTAFVYEGSEEAVKKALVDRHPRSDYLLATKLNASMLCHDEESAKQQFYTSLERTGAGYFDFYLLHALSKNNIEKYNEYHLWDFVKELKEKGLIRNYGFSFHDSPELLDQLLTEHPDVSFVQLQINYADWTNPHINSRDCYLVARKHNKPIVVMEPVKGGSLANPPDVVKAVFDAYNPEVSYASWAIRFVASLDGILTVLSGMSNVAQMKDNLSYMKAFEPLSEEEVEVIKKAQEALATVPQIACTACHYCTEGCPMSINIPGVFRSYNEYLLYQDLDKAKDSYNFRTKNGGKASECIQCGACEQQCPQHLEIRELLEQSASTLE